MVAYLLYLFLTEMLAMFCAYTIDAFVKCINNKKSKYFNISAKKYYIFRCLGIRKNLVSRATVIFQIWNLVYVVFYTVCLCVECPVELLPGRPTTIMEKILTYVPIALWCVYITTDLTLSIIANILRPKDIDRMSKF